MRGPFRLLPALQLLVAAVSSAAAATVPAVCLTQAPATNQPTVCIAAFSDETGGRTWDGIAPAVRDLLAASLSDHRTARVLDREEIDRLLKEQQLGATGLTAPETAARLGRLLGAQRLITGSVMLSEGDVLVVAHVLDVDTAVVTASCRAHGRPQDVTDVVATLAVQLARALRQPFDPGPVGNVDTSPLASLHYLRAMGYYHAGNFDRAILELMTCGDIDASQPLLPYWMGRAFFALGEFDHSQIELERFLADARTGVETAEAAALLATCRQKQRDAPAAALPAAMLNRGNGTP